MSEPTVPSPLTDDERMILKTAAFGAVFLVSNAEPGVLSMIKESFAASGAIAGTTGLVHQALTGGGLPRLPSSAPADVESEVLPALRRAVRILSAKAPGELEPYRDAVVRATRQVAEAVDGVSPGEAEMLAKVREALALPA